MCGICGEIKKENETAGRQLQAMCDSMVHRGPDDQGTHTEANIAFGQRRLSILDLSPLGHQPMYSPDGKVCIVYNGELYNFVSLRKELEAKGHAFKSQCDTEVILYAYLEWGIGSFARFNGMFAIAIYDNRNQQVYLVRDPQGIKPLYYHVCDNKILFGSEIRVFETYNPHWAKNEEWPIWFLTFGFIPSPHTTLKNVFVLPKGYYLQINAQTLQTQSHQFFAYQFTNTINNERDALQQIRTTLFSAVERQLISDAPIGIFLSGGIDSSLLALIADKLGHNDLNTLSIVFKEAEFSEEPFQKRVLRAMRPVNHQSYEVDGSMFMNQLDNIFEAMDQPSWDGVNSYFIAECAKNAGLKAVLSGLGGDELFGGYPSFRRIHLLNMMQYVPGFAKKMAGMVPYSPLHRVPFLNLNNGYGEYLFLRGGYTPATIAAVTGNTEKKVWETLSRLQFSESLPIRNRNLASHLESSVYMTDQLLKDTDYMSMWHSIEVRVPFLDREVIELTYAIDPAIKYNFEQPKYLITKAFEDILPQEVIFRKKQGFTFPFSVWLLQNLDTFASMLPNNPATHKLLRQFKEGSIHWSRIWSLVVMNRFMK